MKVGQMSRAILRGLRLFCAALPIYLVLGGCESRAHEIHTHPPLETRIERIREHIEQMESEPRTPEAGLNAQEGENSAQCVHDIPRETYTDGRAQSFDSSHGVRQVGKPRDCGQKRGGPCLLPFLANWKSDLRRWIEYFVSVPGESRDEADRSEE